MSTTPPPMQGTSGAATKGGGFSGWLREMPTWKKVLCGAAVAAVVVGGVLMLTGSGATEQAGGVPGQPGAGGLLPGQKLGPDSGAAPAAEPASHGVFRLGFSFLAGFCLGSFVRATMKIAAIAFGFWLAMTFALAYFDLLHVDWQAIDGLWNRFTGNVEKEWGSFQTFVTGSLPAAGLATLGLVAGIKRR